MAKRAYYRNGVVIWFDDKGCYHRENGPAAAVWDDGSRWWCRHGRLHFAHGPAILNADGTVRWYEDDRYLRGREPYG